jgi:hypothetical protein
MLFAMQEDDEVPTAFIHFVVLAPSSSNPDSKDASVSWKFQKGLFDQHYPHNPLHCFESCVHRLWRPPRA